MQRIEKCCAVCRNPEWAALLRLAGRAALEAGEIIRSRYGQPHQVRYKGAIDLVTEADLASEAAILACLQAGRPGVEILAEESRAGYSEVPRGAAWIVDPLDGTTNFAHGFPFFGVSIAYTEAGLGKVGVIYCPISDELFCACQGEGAWLNGEPIRVSEVETLERSLVATGFPYDIQENLARVLAPFQALLPVVQDIRRAGAAALDMAYVACGRLDGFWEIKLKPWDTAAGQLLVTEAGGAVTDFQGGSYNPFLPEVLVSNGRIHGQLQPYLAAGK